MNFDIKKEELKPIYDNRKSFYKKAYIEYHTEWNELYSRIKKIKLYSYNTIICTIEYIDSENRFYHIHNDNLISQTTLRHLKEFLLQLFYCKEKTLTKKEILKNRTTKYNVVQDVFIDLPY